MQILELSQSKFCCFSFIQQVIPSVVNIIEGSERFNRGIDEEYSIMIVGIPNVGKSSLINALRRMYIKRGVYL